MNKTTLLSHPRRRLLKSSIVSVSTAAVVAPLVPTHWKKPIISSVLLPAHAQTTPVPGGGSSSGGSSGGSSTSLRDPCDVALVSGDTTTATVGIRVSGTVIPAIGGVTVTINASAVPTGTSAGPIAVVTAADGTYITAPFNLVGPGITQINVISSIPGDTATCQLDVVAGGGGSGSGGVP